MRSPFAYAAATSLFAIAAPLHASGSAVEATDTASEAEDADGPTIVVEGERGTYGVKRTSTATRTDTAIKDIPQAITVITEGQIEDQGLRSIADVLTFVPGATPGTGEGNRDQITLRGNNTTADFFRDGVRDDVQYFRDLYNVDRVEILKGSNAMIFGRGGGGGVVNRVTKVPTFGSRREFALIGDSEGGVRATADVDQRIGQAIGLRINAMVEDGDSFRREVDLDRHAINPTLAINVGDATRIDLSYEYLHDERTTDRGVPADGSRPIEGYDRTFFGDPGRSFADADVHIATVAVEHRLAEGLTLRNRTLYGDYDKFYQNVYPSDYLEATRQVRLAAYNDVTTRRNLFSQTDLVWNSRLGGIDQTLLLGFEVGHQEGRNQRRNGLFSSTATGPTSILVPVDAATVDTPVTYVPNGPNVRIDASIAAAFVQDQIRLASFADLIVGLRFDRFSLEVDNLSSGVTFRRTDRLWSPRVGLVLKPAATLSLYSSYSRSYLPSGGDQFSSLDVTSDALKPERFDNIEAGAKWEPLPGLLATAAVYQLDRTNTRAPGPTPGTVVLTGEQRSRGLEIGLERSVTDRWQISAGYAWQRAEVRERTSACNPATARCEVPLVPRHTFSLWTRYDVTRDLGLGLGVIARSKSFASIGNAVTLPGYQRIDAAVFYKLTDAIQAQINVENLLGADYFATAHNDNNIAPGAPTTARASVRFAF